MNEDPRRPFYAEFAWAFDLLIDRPVHKECAVIAGWLCDRGVRPGDDVLDAGCGTGRYAIELARFGYTVHGVDRSPELVDVADRTIVGLAGRTLFSVGDIGDLCNDQYAAVLCRGVLNDIVTDEERDRVFRSFARVLSPGGVLILDVRDWEATANRKAQDPVFEKSVSSPRGKLTFKSVTRLDFAKRRLLVTERHELSDAGAKHIRDHEFVMRCWQKEELAALLAKHGFEDVAWFGAYEAGVALGATDRLVAVCQRGLVAS